MLFNSLRFAYFLPCVVLAYYLAPRRFRVLLLVLASCLFYASWDVRFLPLILGMTLLNYGLGLGLERLADRQRAVRALLALGIAANLLILAFFKYALFFLDNLTGALARVGWDVSPPAFSISIILPLGISFFTFEFIHYLVDVSRGQPAVHAPLRFAAFATFFPTQIAGPIKRYEDFVPQLEANTAQTARAAQGAPAPAPAFDWALIGAGLRLIVVGLFKKVALADNLAPIVAHGFPHGSASAGAIALGRWDAWLVALAFSLQIYFDFSGYTDVGRGAASLLGFRVPENFARPYLARNISDFWRRWHISLSSWLRDYLYIPLGGSRRHRMRNLLVTMILGGLWHGANWTFAVWGVWHGTFLALFWLLHPWWSARMAWMHGRTTGRVWALPLAVAARGATFLIVILGWVFFRAESLHQAAAFLARMLAPHTATAALLSSERLTVLAVAALCFAVEGVREWAARPLPAVPLWPARLVSALGWWYRQVRPVETVCLLALMLLLKPSVGPRFIYFQF